MAQLSTNTLATAQVVAKVQEFIAEYVKNNNVSPEEYDKAYQNLVIEVKKSIGGPMSSLDFINKGDVPSSERLNKFIRNISNDINIVTHQMDSLTANYMNTFNVIHDEIESEKSSIDRIRSKIAALELYSGSVSSNITYFGDLLNNMDMIDANKSNQVGLCDVSDGIACLPKKDIKPWKSKIIVHNPNYNEANSSLTSVFGVSNGLPGCNFLYSNQALGNISNPYLFQKDSSMNKSDPAKMTDESPASYMEYEALYIDKNQQSVVRPDYEFQYINNKTTVDWASFAHSSKPLKLTVELTSTRSSGDYVNYISIVPFFGYDNTDLNAAIKNTKITSIKIYNEKDKNKVYEIINGGPVFIGADISGATLSNYNNYSYNKGVFRFPEVLANKIYITFEQPEFKDVKIKHSYWTPYSSEDFKKNTDAPTWKNQKRFNPKVLTQDGVEEGTIKWDQTAIVPSIETPNAVKGSTSDIVRLSLSYITRSANQQPVSKQETVFLKRSYEFLDAKRASIGIRDIYVGKETFVEKAEIVSKPFYVHKDVDLLSLEVSDEVPSSDDYSTSIDYYISVDDGLGWIKISPLQRNFEGVPEIISFNQNLSSNNSLPQIAYYSYPEVPNPIKSIRFRAVLKKTKNGNLTPILGSYKIGVRFR